MSASVARDWSFEIESGWWFVSELHRSWFPLHCHVSTSSYIALVVRPSIDDRDNLTFQYSLSQHSLLSVDLGIRFPCVQMAGIVLASLPVFFRLFSRGDSTAGFG